MNYSGITDCSIVDGNGFRVVLFVSGCCHNCPGCHNPETHDYNFGKPFTQEVADKILELLDRPYISGLTISGGDPLDPKNRSEVLKLIQLVKEKYPNKTVWVYTGYIYEEIYQECDLSKIDVLVDGPFILDKANPSLKFRGSSNQRILDINDEINS